jgi:alpha-tubulin suppressor-like RCC1 family protein
VSVGYYHSCAVEASGTVKCFGYNEFGESGGSNLGNGQFAPPTAINLGGKAVSVAASDYASCAVLEGGAAKCWGAGDDGQLGDGLSTDSATPVNVALGAPARAVAQSAISFCALLENGGVQCWGGGGGGGVGTGDPADHPTPVSVDIGNHRAVSIVGGYSKICVVTDDGQLWCWGSNGYDEISESAGSTVYTATQIDLGGASAKAAAADYEHICIVTATGTVKCWGANYYGQLGDGTTDPQPVSTPVTVNLGEPAVAITVGWYHSCAQLQSGAVKCWGYNDYGQLGADSGLHQSELPIDYAAHSAPIRTITAGSGATCVALTTGALECTGYYVPYYMNAAATDSDQFGPLLISGVDMTPAPDGPSPIAGKIEKPKWKLTRKGSKITAKSTLVVTATGMDATHCVGDLQVSVPASSSGGKSASAPTFALKFANGKCTAAAKRTIPLRVAKKGAKLKVYLKNAKLLTASPVTSTTKLPKH